MAGLIGATSTVAFVAAVVIGCAGPRPTDLGVHGARLTPCPSSPNCISSHAAQEDDHYAPPLAFEGDAALAWKAAIEAAKALDRAKVVEEREGYLWLEVASRVFGFVDDFELALDATGRRIDVRSASRVGHSDLGVNRARIEDVRAAFERELRAPK